MGQAFESGSGWQAFRSFPGTPASLLAVSASEFDVFLPSRSNLPQRNSPFKPITCNYFNVLRLHWNDIQLSLDRDRNHVVTSYLMLSNHPRRPAPQAASPRNLCVRRLPRLPCLPRLCRGASRDPGRTTPQAASLRNLCVLRVSALDSSSLGLTFNLQLSTFNRVSFPSSHLSLSQRSSKSFTIRTSETPLPQPLYNPHLRAPLGSAGNKGLITPLESALTRNSPVTPVESALTKRGGAGPSQPSTFRHSDLVSIHPLYFHTLPNSFVLFCTCEKFKPFIFKQFRTLCEKHPGVGGSF